MRPIRTISAAAAAALLFLSGCADDVAGTVSGTENTVTVALAPGITTPSAAAKLARVRFWEAGSFPEAVTGKAQTSVEAEGNGGSFSAALASSKIWNAELIGADSSWRLWIPGIEPHSKRVSVVAGPLVQTETLSGRLKGDLGDEAYAGLAGTGRWSRVSSDGTFALAQIHGADLPLVVARKSDGAWGAVRIEDWSAPTGETELPETIGLPAPVPAGALATTPSLSAWDCSTAGGFSETASPAEAPAGDLFRILVPGNGLTALVRLDLCHRTTTVLVEIPSTENLILFSGKTSDWVYAPGTDTLWEAPRNSNAVVPHPGAYTDQVGVLAAAAHGDTVASYLQRPEANVLSLYGSADAFVRDDPSRSVTLENAPGSGDEKAFALLESARVLIAGENGAVSFHSLEDGRLLESWTLEGNPVLRGTARAANGRIAGLAADGSGTESAAAGTSLRVWEPNTGAQLSSVGGLPAGAYGLAH